MKRRIFSQEAHARLGELFLEQTGVELPMADDQTFRAGMTDVALALIEQHDPALEPARGRSWQRGHKLRLVIQVRRLARSGEGIRAACRTLAAGGEYPQSPESLYRTFKRATSADASLLKEAELVLDMFEGKLA